MLQLRLVIFLYVNSDNNMSGGIYHEKKTNYNASFYDAIYFEYRCGYRMEQHTDTK